MDTKPPRENLFTLLRYVVDDNGRVVRFVVAMAAVGLRVDSLGDTAVTVAWVIVEHARGNSVKHLLYSLRLKFLPLILVS